MSSTAYYSATFYLSHRKPLLVVRSALSCLACRKIQSGLYIRKPSIPF